MLVASTHISHKFLHPPKTGLPYVPKTRDNPNFRGIVFKCARRSGPAFVEEKYGNPTRRLPLGCAGPATHSAGLHRHQNAPQKPPEMLPVKAG